MSVLTSLYFSCSILSHSPFFSSPLLSISDSILSPMSMLAGSQDDGVADFMSIYISTSRVWPTVVRFHSSRILWPSVPVWAPSNSHAPCVRYTSCTRNFGDLQFDPDSKLATHFSQHLLIFQSICWYFSQFVSTVSQFYGRGFPPNALSNSHAPCSDNILHPKLWLSTIRPQTPPTRKPHSLSNSQIVYPSISWHHESDRALSFP
jgi:hypothetical protein